MKTLADLTPYSAFTVKGGRNITPTMETVEVVWVDEPGDAVHYRKRPFSQVHQTTIKRFLEIVNKAAVNG